MLKWKGVFLGLQALLLGTFVLTGCAAKAIPNDQPVANQLNKNSTAATVNGDPVTVAELQLMMLPLRAGIYQYFQEKYQVSDNPKFWISTYGGENPLEMIRDRALLVVIKNKVVQQFAKEQDLTKDNSYAQFLKDYVNENARRKTAVAKKEPIYGPTQYSLQDFYQYQLANLTNSSRDALAKVHPITEGELQQKYNENKDTYKTEGAVTIKKVVLPTTDSNASMQTVNAKLNQMKALVLSGKTFEEAAQTNNLQVTQQVIDVQSGKSDAIEAPLMRKAAFSLSVGQISDVIEDQSVSYLIQATAKSDPIYKTFAEVKSGLEQKLYQEQYDAKINALVKSAQVQIQHDSYDKTVPQ